MKGAIMNITATLPLIEESLLFFLFTMAELTMLFIGISFLVGLLNEFLPQEKDTLVPGFHHKADSAFSPAFEEDCKNPAPAAVTTTCCSHLS